MAKDTDKTTSEKPADKNVHAGTPAAKENKLSIADQFAADFAAEGFTAMNNDVVGFWAPMLKLDLGGGTFREEIIPFRGIPVEERTRELSQRDAEEGRAVGQKYLVVCLTRECQVKEANDNTKIITAKPGDFVWVDSRAKLSAIHDKLPQKDASGKVHVFEVGFVPKEKIAIKGAHTMWTGQFFAKEIPMSEAAKYKITAEHVKAPQLTAGPAVHQGEIVPRNGAAAPF